MVLNVDVHIFKTDLSFDFAFEREATLTAIRTD